MTATTATNEQIAAAIVDRAIRTLEPPQTLETGTLVLLRMAAHSRSPEQREYFAPAVVLAQYEPNGEIDALVWDASAGNAFVHGYAIRDLGTRDTAAGREQYVIQSNIGQVLFSPAEFARLADEHEQSLTQIGRLWQARKQMVEQQIEFQKGIMDRLLALEAAATTPAATSEDVPVPQPAASLEAKQQPKADAKRT